MRYATWNYFLDTETNEKTTPPQGDGACFLGTDEAQILGYLSDGVEVTSLAKWSVVEITEAQFFALALSRNPLATMVVGKVLFPRDEILL